MNGYFAVKETESPGVLPELDVCRRARGKRDARFDGRFFVGVLTTGIYCRVICPARMAKEANVHYYPSAAAAQGAGLRPCRRCRPEAAPRLPEWVISSDTLVRALRYIEAGYLNEQGVSELASELGVGDRQLSQLFQAELAATADAIAELYRARFARELLESTKLNDQDVAFHAGFGGVDHCDSAMRGIYQKSAKEIHANAPLDAGATVTIPMPVRGPYNHDWMFTYLKRRAINRLEAVSGHSGNWCFTRTLRCGAKVKVRQTASGLTADLPLTDEPLYSLLNRVRRVFDLNTDGDVLHEHLRSDALLGDWVERLPGLRVPGAWDGYELSVRAILGQQVSVERGTDLANKIVTLYGKGCFPAPQTLKEQNIAEIGMPGQRGRAIAELARQIAEGELKVDECQNYESAQAKLQSNAGIGPWTANYIRMRILRDPDAFPDNDWVVLKTLQTTPAGARKRANVWRPWRAYGLMYLWYASATIRAQNAHARRIT